MSYARVVLIAVVVFFSTALSANEVNVSINSEAVQASYIAPQSENGLQLDFGVLRNEDEGNILAAGLHVVDRVAADTNFKVGLGGKLFFVDPEDGDEGGAVGLGAHFRYIFPAADRFSVSGSGYFAPEVLTFSDVEEYIEYNLQAEYAVLRQARVFVGYRKIEAEFEGFGDVTIESGAHIGLNISF
ncbi:MAG: YfaZ family protein [Gammaproteobacteria bacterium]|nr:YfaZ family protein [Gammaproteobacteria bacterium]